jgi:hypothetical protein
MLLSTNEKERGMSGNIDKWCVMCGAAPGEPCTVISGDPEAGEKPGDIRREPHFYRNSDTKPAVLIPDEPDFV